MPAERLTPAECAQLGSLASAVDCRKVRLYREDRGISGMARSAVLRLSGGRAVALGNHVFLPDRCRRDLPVLAHELTHCGQYQAWGPWAYLSRGAATQLRDLLHRTLRLGTSPYRYHPESAKPFGAYGMEQQGQIVEDCFRGHPAAQEISPFHPGPEI
jgi:uncharacterized protein DUF4157